MTHSDGLLGSALGPALDTMGLWRTDQQMETLSNKIQINQHIGHIFMVTWTEEQTNHQKFTVLILSLPPRQSIKGSELWFYHLQKEKDDMEINWKINSQLFCSANSSRLAVWS